jgi:hypothetical protein
MSYKDKYLKYKNKYLELLAKNNNSLYIRQIMKGGEHKNKCLDNFELIKKKMKELNNYSQDLIKTTQLIRKFIHENSKITEQIISNPIDEIKKNNYIMSFQNEDERKIKQTICMDIKHVSSLDFEVLIKELCDAYNNSKQKDDIYILVYMPKPESGSGGFKYYTKSSFYVTTIAGTYLNYDYIIDLTVKEGDSKDPNDFSELIKKLINTIVKNEEKNIYLHFADDCSYSGEQIEKMITYLIPDILTNFDNNIFLYYRFIIPFILNKRIFNEISIDSDICDYIKHIDKLSLLNDFNIITEKYKSTIDNLESEINNESEINKNKKIILLYKKMAGEQKKMLIEKISEPNKGSYNNKSIELSSKKHLYMIDMKPVLNIINRNNSMIKKYNEQYLLYFDTKIADSRSIPTDIVKSIVTHPEFTIGQYSKFKYYFDNKEIEFTPNKTFSELLYSL